MEQVSITIFSLGSPKFDILKLHAEAIELKINKKLIIKKYNFSHCVASVTTASNATILLFWLLHFVLDPSQPQEYIV